MVRDALDHVASVNVQIFGDVQRLHAHAGSGPSLGDAPDCTEERGLLSPAPMGENDRRLFGGEVADFNRAGDGGGGGHRRSPLAGVIRRDMLACMDADTLRKVAKLARSRARPPRNLDKRDGLMRLGAEKALEQFAKDLEVMAQHCR